ncbi:aldo/keto reductase [Dinghuibacter silviterrae]|uniref:Aryl-alcohol dehydrogenase-like predicted oxidoreductase n=1 Tax=Dinghuibacter silviterrae TaxID=1539049 RepID=A0A4R8DTF7_9BACT|nr:aldo/keto reductase [Dinghuibacter silviterrae]TDX01198.1 aryl-alcohol dehydrogenase-like predicted oxidoreductase [Dinghuibacter silviterrae]
MKATYTIGGDLTIHRMGYGAMRITGKGIWGPPRDKAEALRVLQRAVELGVDFIDTADSYGPHVSEELIAEALHPYKKGLVIATKGGLTRPGPDVWHQDARPEHLKEALQGSLKRLKLDKIDLYQLHRIDAKVPFEKTMAFLQDAQEKGLIRHIGLSEVSVEEIQKAQKYIKVVSVQNKYSVDYRRWESVLEFTRDNDIAFIPWYPLNAGNIEAMHTLEAIGREAGGTAHQVALAWLLHHSPNILLIPGTSSVSHLEENMGAAALKLSETQMARLEALGVTSVG